MEAQGGAVRVERVVEAGGGNIPRAAEAVGRNGDGRLEGSAAHYRQIGRHGGDSQGGQLLPQKRLAL